jgi:hypothetical protein
MLSYQKNIVNQYKYGIKLAIASKDKVAADYIETMKNQHTQNLQVASSHDTAKLTAISTSASLWRGGGNCDLLLEGRVNELF